MIDIRRALEAITPNARWDFSIPNEGGTELQYNNIRWDDPRNKPAWADLVAIAEGFAAADLLAMRQGMQCGALQFRKALRAFGKMDAVKAYVEQADEETQEAWEYATSFTRLDPFITVGMAALGVSDEEVDAVFELAITL